MQKVIIALILFVFLQSNLSDKLKVIGYVKKTRSEERRVGKE